MNSENYPIKLKKVHIKLLEPGIVENLVLEGEDIDANDLREVKKNNLLITENKKYAVLIVTTDFVGFSKAARELLAGGEIAKNTQAYAFLISNFAHRILGNYYLSVNKPKSPSRLFTDRKKALRWLRSNLKTEK